MEQLDTLRRELAADDVAIRRIAAEQLMQAGSAAAGAAVELARAAADDDEEVANFAGEALENLGPPEPTALGPLCELLSAGAAASAYWAATLLGRLGKNGVAAEPALVTALQSHADLATRERAAWALGKIGVTTAAAREALQQAASSDHLRLARLAQEGLVAQSLRD